MNKTLVVPVVLDDPQDIFRSVFAPTKVSEANPVATQKGPLVFSDGKGHKVMEAPLLNHIYKSLPKGTGKQDGEKVYGIRKAVNKETKQEEIIVDDTAVFAKITYERLPNGTPKVTFG